MSSQAHALYRLQQIDLESLEHQKRLHEIAAQLGNNEVIQSAQTAVAEIEARLKPLHVKSRNLELEMQANAQKAKSSEDRLYSGNIKNPKEMQDLQHEIDSLKKRNGQLEDQALELMLTIESEESDLTANNEVLKATVAEWEAQHGDLLTEQAQREARLKALSTERDNALQNITPQNRKLYDTMKPKKGNRPVAMIKERSCVTCGVEQTMAIELAVQREEAFVYCENCGRILISL